MPNVIRLTREVAAAEIWSVVAIRSKHGWRWLRLHTGVVRWTAGIAIAAVLFIILITHWPEYKAQRQAFVPIFTLAAGLAVAGVALMRHFAQTEADRQRRITESFSTAIEQLGSDKVEVRLGGIYTLQRVSNESPDDYWSIMEALTAFARERSARTRIVHLFNGEDERVCRTAYQFWLEAGCPEGRSEEFWFEATQMEQGVPTDIAAVLSTLVRRSRKNRIRERENQLRLDLSGTDLRRAVLNEAPLTGIILRDARLDGAYLVGAHLDYADLRGASLKGAMLIDSHLEDANLSGANLEGARMNGARRAPISTAPRAYGVDASRS